MAPTRRPRLRQGRQGAAPPRSHPPGGPGLRILLTGATGQVGQAFLEVATGVDVVASGHDAASPIRFDLDEPATAAGAVRAARPDWVVHTAAMTNVDACERDPERARVQNATATGALAQAARDAGARFLYVSTDYVFDGQKGNYREDDATNPVNQYGETKLEGERLALAAMPDATLARTSVVFGPHKTNFVTWLVTELRAGRVVRIVEDQTITPTYAHDVASQLLALLRAGATGIHHTAGATRATRLDIAREVANAFRLDASLIVPIRSKDLAWLAARPPDTSLDTTKIAKLHPPMTLRDALAQYRSHPRSPKET